MNLAKYKRHVKYKLIVMSLALLLPILAFILTIVITNKVLSYNLILGIISLCAIELVIVYKICIYSLILKKEEFAKNKYVALTDERNSFIKMKSLNLSFKIILFFSLIALIITAFIYITGFYIILSYMLAMLLSMIFTFIYFKHKY